jgi:hypothetical protein
MKKLRLNLDRLAVESFTTDAERGAKGTVEGLQDTECSKQYTCGIASRGEKGYEEAPPTRYGCCI